MNRLEKLKEMERVNPRDAFLKFAIALEYVSINKAEAIGLLETLLQESPDYLPSYYQLGKLHQEMDDRKRAAEVFQSGLKLAEAAGEKKTARELKEALEQIEDEY